MSIHTLHYPTLNTSVSANGFRWMKDVPFAGTRSGLFFERLFIKINSWSLARNLAKTALKFEQITSSLRNIGYERAKELLPEIFRMIQTIENISSEGFDVIENKRMNNAITATRKVLYKHEAIVKKIISSHESDIIPTEDYIKNGLSKFSSEAIK